MRGYPRETPDCNLQFFPPIFWSFLKHMRKKNWRYVKLQIYEAYDGLMRQASHLFSNIILSNNNT
jgi:hypothetical protein